MKKTLLLTLLTLAFGVARAQCTSSCSNYNMAPITFSLFSTAGTTVNSMFLPSADDGTVNVPIGFNFNFYCGTYNSVNICSNGFIQLDYGTPIYFGNPPYVNPTQSFPDPTAPNGLIALRMDDYDATTSGSIVYNTFGSAPNRIFVVTYDAVPIWYNAILNSPPSPVYTTGQIVLYETSNVIEIHSGDIQLSPNVCTQGIENISGSSGMAPAGWNNSIWSTNSTAYRFAPFTPSPPTSVSGATNVCQGSQNAYITTPMAGATSYSWSFPTGWTGSGNTTAANGIPGASGSISVTATYTCGVSVPAVLSVSVIPSPTVAILSASPTVLCSGNTFTITPGGASTYVLNPGNYTGSSPFVITAASSAVYTLTGTDANTNCQSFNLATTSIQVDASPTITVNSGSICAGQSFTMLANGANSYNYTGGFPVVSPSAPGSYTYAVTGTASNGCVSMAAAISSLNVNANPTVSIVASKLAICKGESAVLTGTGASTYAWNGGQNTNSISVNPTTNTTYTVTGSSAEGCNKSKSITIAVYACVGIEEVGNSTAGVSVYPNPTAGVFSLKFDAAPNGARYELFDATGRLIAAQIVDKAEMRLDLSGHAAGLYYIKIKSGEATQTLKIVKE